MGRENDNQDTKVHEVDSYGPPLMQDLDPKLSKALSNAPHARRHARDAAALIKQQHEQEKIWQHQSPK